MRTDRKRTRWFKIALITVELIGLGLSIFMLLISMRLIYTKSEPCPRSRIFKCHSVMRGKYSKLGPVINVEGTYVGSTLSAVLQRPVRQVGPFSVAGMGALYFAFQIGLTFLARPKGSWVSRIKLLSAAAGMAFLAYLRAIEILWLHGICPWCYGAMLAAFVETMMIWHLNVPPLPRRWGFARQFLAVFGLFLAMVALCTAGLWLHTRLRAVPVAPPEPPEETPVVETTPASSGTTTPVDTGSTKPKHTVKPARKDPDWVEPVDPATDSAEKQILRKRGWKILRDPKGIHETVGSKPPVLLLVFDPNCEVCQALIAGTLADPQCDELKVTKLAIEVGNLGSDLPDVRNAPTILVFDADGKVRFRHEDEMDLETFIRSIEYALSPQSKTN